MTVKKRGSSRKIRSVLDVERKLVAQIRGETVHGGKLSRVPKLHRKKFYVTEQRKIKKMRGEESKFLKKLEQLRKKMTETAVKVQVAIKHDQEIQDGYLSDKELRDFKVRK